MRKKTYEKKHISKIQHRSKLSILIPELDNRKDNSAKCRNYTYWLNAIPIRSQCSLSIFLLRSVFFPILYPEYHRH